VSARGAEESGIRLRRMGRGVVCTATGARTIDPDGFCRRRLDLAELCSSNPGFPFTSISARDLQGSPGEGARSGKWKL